MRVRSTNRTDALIRPGIEGCSNALVRVKRCLGKGNRRNLVYVHGVYCGPGTSAIKSRDDRDDREWQYTDVRPEVIVYKRNPAVFEGMFGMVCADGKWKASAQGDDPPTAEFDHRTAI